MTLRDRVGNAARLNNVPFLKLKRGVPSGALTRVVVSVMLGGGGGGGGVGVGVGVGGGGGGLLSRILLNFATVECWSPPWGPPVISQ